MSRRFFRCSIFTSVSSGWPFDCPAPTASLTAPDTAAAASPKSSPAAVATEASPPPPTSATPFSGIATLRGGVSPENGTSAADGGAPKTTLPATAAATEDPSAPPTDAGISLSAVGTTTSASGTPASSDGKPDTEAGAVPVAEEEASGVLPRSLLSTPAAMRQRARGSCGSEAGRVDDYVHGSGTNISKSGKENRPEQNRTI